MYVLHPILVRPFTCTQKICEMYVNPSMATDPHITTHTSLGMAWWFANTVEPWPIYLVSHPKYPWGWCGGLQILQTLGPLALDSVWCTMSSNHIYRYWHHSQFINGLIHYCVSNKARGSHPYWPHNTPRRMDQHGWKKTGTLLASAWDSALQGGFA